MASINPSCGLLAAILAAPLLLGGCFLREESLGDRCADAMKRAFPGGDIRTGNVSVENDSSLGVSGMRATVEGVRRDVPEGGPLLRDVAVECGFENNILVRFRWTKGPLVPAAPPQSPPASPAPAETR